jgi:uncharacterized repeat protein (TIGR03843 family)
MSAHELSTPTIPDPERFMMDGDVEVEGRMPWSSNATFLVHVTADGARHRAIYKPVRGERPLWDFEPGLHRREVAAYRLSELLGVGVVPPTVVRDGPYGEGSFQWFVEADHREHYFTIFEQRDDLHDQLRAIAALDIIANNTDRKSGHCLLADDRVWAIDNGLCFAAAFKLRTVIWEFAEEPVPPAVLACIEPLATTVPLELAALLSDDEVDALSHRAARLVAAGCFPSDDSGHRYPWPLV